MKLSELEKNLLDINNDKIPDNVMKQFWHLKETLGTSPMGVSKINDIYYIICPSFKSYILWHTYPEEQC